VGRVTRDVYISDADIEMSKDVESLRIDRHLVTDLSSVMPGRRRKMTDRIEEHARKNPLAMIPLLLKYRGHENPRVRQQVAASLARLTQSESGEQALMESLFSRNKRVADAAARMLEDRNFNSVNLLATYRAARELVMQARKADVFCTDVEELIVDSVETFKEGRFDQAMTNMMMARDLLEDRLEWHGHIRNYIKEVLRLTPQLGRSGVQVDSIQDSIRNLATAMETREYGDARSLLEIRRQETRLWKQLWSLEEYLTKRIKGKPSVDLLVLQDADRMVLESFKKTAELVEESIQDGRPIDALREVEHFVTSEMSAGYLANEGKRLDSTDEAAWLTMWSVGLGVLKLIAPVIPNVAEEFYQQYFRDHEVSPSIHTVEWPDPLSDIGKKSRQGKGSGGRKRGSSSKTEA